MKNILVPVEVNSSIDSVLVSALLLGQLFDSYVEGIGLGPDLPDLVVGDLPVIWTVADPNGWRDLIEEDRRRFETFMRDNHVPAGSRAASAETARLRYGWSETESLGDSVAGRLARVFDISIVGRPGGNRGDPRMATAETMLFESGRPVILAPPVPPTSIGETIFISWNRSVEASRAVVAAMPLLKQARRVVVSTVGSNEVEGPSADSLALMLRGHGIDADAQVKTDRSRSNGELILEHAAAVGADLLIKGAYTQSRLRQMLFGGATTHILNNATLPVLMTA